ncbi:MAG: hypothetical protein M0009_11935 [Deltaproteobacteria bacterium]|nr:hypothetical protein [Deltaproteobacteria bacterium]
MKSDKGYLQELTEKGEFRFTRLELSDIDNEPVFRVNAPDMVNEETCLFHRSIATGDDYLALLNEYIQRALMERKAAPVVRFADGEYAFYHLTLGCNGLYRQAESVAAIRKAMALHSDAFRRLAALGKLAPLIFPGNAIRRKKRGLLSFLGRSEEEPSSAAFLDFLREKGVELTGENYVPFYALYAYLTSEAFARLVDGKVLSILNSDFDPEACRSWFARFSSRPEIRFTKIPAEYIATRWESMREKILNEVPSDADLCLAGAGVGALPLCVDVADRFSIPVLDAGHVLNMMNGREDKSNGMRLYTLRKPAGTAPIP